MEQYNEMGPYFQSAKGVRQGDPISPTLFNLVDESLTKMVLKAQSNDMLVGLAADLIPHGVAILQYADDSVLCISHDPDKAINLKVLLYSFELMSGLRINYMKSEVFLVGGDNDIANFYSNMFGCHVGKLPLKYLGIPVSSRVLKNFDWDFIDAKLIEKPDSWIGISTSSGGKKFLIDACYPHTFIILCPCSFSRNLSLKKLISIRKDFLAKKRKDKKSYYMVKWSKVCRSKIKEGLVLKI
jgi:hypothetical protein